MMDFGSTTYYGYQAWTMNNGEPTPPYDWVGIFHDVRNPPPDFDVMLQKAYIECDGHDYMNIWSFHNTTLLILEFVNNPEKAYDYGQPEDQRMRGAFDDGESRDTPPDY